MLAEKEVKKALKNGDSHAISDAFSRLYNENVRLVYRVLIDAYGKDEETDDDVQESFLSLIEQGDRLLTIDRIVDYWISSAKFICARRRKKQERIAVSSEEEVPSQDKGIPELLKEEEFFLQVSAWLGHPNDEIVILRCCYGYTEKEIAKRLNMSEDAINRRYRKGIKEIGRKLKNEKE